MIMVEVFAPALGQTYDFELDENAKIDLIMDEILEMLCRKERRVMPKGAGDFCLGEIDSGRLLNANSSLADYGVKSGSRLILT